MPYRVKCPLVLVKNQAGLVDYHYGQPMPEGSFGPYIAWLSDEQREQFLAEGFVEEIAEPAEPVDVSDPLQDCLKALEQLGVELSAGAPTARTALRKGGYSFANGVVAQAIKARKAAVTAVRDSKNGE
ncbi:hypothetical protein BN1232_02252 [Mycobacterium lentiflavum]|uniref:Uncharacterized protein n=1 Tax=Mycobacterium lentiflavum TaxID=141349 RepID=A0A0E4H0A2_MYCLN|nr:hypothetical protein [Mycobacterium lentiflavum]CQD11938.1 hypothetical protein BN1232_02252 [Mycobacterium lentiflavum]